MYMKNYDDVVAGSTESSETSYSTLETKEKIGSYAKRSVKYNLTRSSIVTTTKWWLCYHHLPYCQGHFDLQLGLELRDTMNFKYESLQLKLKSCFNIFLSTVRWAHTQQLITQILNLISVLDIL